ncbi:hypothetical protein BLOT_009455 [Blomia tropicalis]|nr:hypothetical protein BLOT_009455 [Blomia tropicalis]
MKTIVFSDGHRDTNTNVKIVQQQKQAGKEENKQKNTCDFCLQYHLEIKNTRNKKNGSSTRETIGILCAKNRL